MGRLFELAGRYLRRMGYLLTRGRRQRALADELEQHRLASRDALMAGGMSPRDAELTSRRRLGNVTLAREDTAAEWGWTWIDATGQDVRYALRTLRVAPGFTIVAVVSLALGIAATTAIFSIVDGVLLRPLPYAAPDRLVVLGRPASVAPGSYVDWHERAHAFSMSGAAEFWTPNLADDAHAEQIYALHVTPSLFPTLGVPAALGRTFVDGDAHAGRDQVIVISDRFWKTHFQRAADALGARLMLDGRPYTVVGVMPPSFRFAPFWATRAELWAPLVLDERRSDREGSSLRMFARLGPGVTLAAARGEMDVLARALDARFPNTNSGVQILALHDRVVGGVRVPLMSLLGAVFLVLLIACSNVAHLQLVRGANRGREMALRTAIGASHVRLARQMFTESFLISAMSGVLGCWATYGVVGFLVWLAPATLPRLEAVQVDGRVLAFGVLISAASSVFFGLVPAWRMARVDPAGALKAGVRGTAAGAVGRARRWLIASEIAMALVLLIGGALLFKSFTSLVLVSPGIDPQGVLSAEVSVKGTSEDGRRLTFFVALVHRLRLTPGVESASAINHLPLAGDTWRLGVSIQGRPHPVSGENVGAIYRVVMPGYFHTMGIPILRGRDITDQDVRSAPHVVVINETMAHKYWPGRDPIGQHITNDDRHPEKTDWFTIVGVVRDAVQSEWGAPTDAETFFPFAQTPLYTDAGSAVSAAMTVVLRVAGDPAAAAPMLVSSVRAINPAVALAHVQTMDAVIAEAFTGARFYLTTLSVFAGVAFVLVLVGLYGVMADTAASRRHEIGVRRRSARAAASWSVGSCGRRYC